METMQIDLWWQSIPQDVKERLFEYGLTENVWQRTDHITKENFRKLCLLNPKPQIDSKDRSLVIEVVGELGDIVLMEKNNLPLEDMCNDDGDFLDAYQEEFNQIYDRIESILRAESEFKLQSL